MQISGVGGGRTCVTVLALGVLLGLVLVHPRRADDSALVDQGSALEARSGLTALEHRAQTLAQKLADHDGRLHGSAPQYESVEKGALASLALQAQRQLSLLKEGRRQPTASPHKKPSASNKSEAAGHRKSSAGSISVDQPSRVPEAHLNSEHASEWTQRDDGKKMKMASDGSLLEPAAQYTLRDDGARLWMDGHVTPPETAKTSPSLGRLALHAIRVAKAKAYVRQVVKNKLAKRKQRLAYIVHGDDDSKVATAHEEQNSQDLRAGQLSTQAGKNPRKGARARMKHAARSQLMWPGEISGENKGGTQVGKQGGVMTSTSAPEASHPTSIADSKYDKSKRDHYGLAWPDKAWEQADKHKGATASTSAPATSHHTLQDSKKDSKQGWHGVPTKQARGDQGDGLAWPDGHLDDAIPVRTGDPSTAVGAPDPKGVWGGQSSWPSGDWPSGDDLSWIKPGQDAARPAGSDWGQPSTPAQAPTGNIEPRRDSESIYSADRLSWPQVARPWQEGVPSQLNLVLLVDGATVASMQHREQGIFEAAVAMIAGVSVNQLHVDYAVDVPGLGGHMEVSLRLLLQQGLSCSAVAAKVRKAVQAGTFNSQLADLGAGGLAVSLLNMSGCPAAMLPVPSGLPPQDSADVEGLGPMGTAAETEGGSGAEGEDQVGRGRGRGWGQRQGQGRGEGLTSDEALEAAQQVATQTAQQVASEVATSAAADTAKRLESELRTLAQRVAKVTATKVTQDIMRHSRAEGGFGGRRAGKNAGALRERFEVQPSALKQLEVAAARNAAQRYGP